MTESLIAEPWVDIDAASEACGISKSRLYRLAREMPDLPCIRVSSREKRFVVSALKRWLLEHPEALAESSRRLTEETKRSEARRALREDAPKARRARRRAPEGSPA